MLFEVELIRGGGLIGIFRGFHFFYNFVLSF